DGGLARLGPVDDRLGLARVQAVGDLLLDLVSGKLPLEVRDLGEEDRPLLVADPVHSEYGDAARLVDELAERRREVNIAGGWSRQASPHQQRDDPLQATHGQILVRHGLVPVLPTAGAYANRSSIGVPVLAGRVKPSGLSRVSGGTPRACS